MTTRQDDPGLSEIHNEGPLKGQQKEYLVLSPEERAKGFTRPVRRSYLHLACRTVTHMGQALAETYARNPKFYSGTFCCRCCQHFDLGPPWNPAFLWTDDDEPVGSNAEEAILYVGNKHKIEAEKNKGSGI